MAIKVKTNAINIADELNKEMESLGFTITLPKEDKKNKDENKKKVNTKK